MLMPIAILYDAGGFPSVLRFLQFTMEQDVNADYTWEDYNSIMSTPWSNLNMLQSRVLNIPVKEAFSKRAMYNIQDGRYYYRGSNYFAGMNGISRVRANGTLAKDYLQAIAVKRTTNQHGNASEAVVTREKLLTGIVEILLVDYNGNIKRYNYNQVMKLYNANKIKIGNIGKDGRMISWELLAIERDVDCASPDLQSKLDNLLNLAELSGTAGEGHAYMHSLRNTMEMTCPANSNSVVVPDGWLILSSNREASPESIVCANYMAGVRLNEVNLRNLSAPRCCCNFEIETSAKMQQLVLPRYMLAAIKPETFSDNAACVTWENQYSAFQLKALSIQNESIDTSGYYDLDKFVLTLNSAPNLQSIKIAQPRYSNNSAERAALVNYRNNGGMHYYYDNSYTNIKIANSPKLQSIYLLKPKHSLGKRYSTDYSMQVLELENAPALQSINIEGKSHLCCIYVKGAKDFGISALALQKMYLDIDTAGVQEPIAIHFHVKYLSYLEIRLHNHLTGAGNDCYCKGIVDLTKGGKAGSFMQTVYIKTVNTSSSTPIETSDNRLIVKS